jgi:hypothetical protein
LMIPDDTEYPLVIIWGDLRVEFNNNPRLRSWKDCSLAFRKWEDVGLVRIKLESSGLITIVTNIEEPVGGRSELHLSKMNTSAG